VDTSGDALKKRRHGYHQQARRGQGTYRAKSISAAAISLLHAIQNVYLEEEITVA